uniref:Glutaredoxin-2, mitochondrial n=1 Tax=Rhodnius prolixus TaxID=13249 RepID=R4FME4_RHOPR
MKQSRYSMGLGSSSLPTDMSGPTAQFVKDAITQDKIVIFSKSYCPYCKMAKDVFDKLKKSYTSIELDGRDDGDQIQSVLNEITGARTVPRVFVNGECVGGGTDVKSLYENGQLEKML